MSKKFTFYCPVEISKAKDEEGNEIMRLGGIASTMDEDSDGEFLDPSGFEIEDFQKLGVINWHHQSTKSPATIIGEPSRVEIRKDGFYVECDLYRSSELAREVYDLAQVMQKDSKSRKLGYSIEGSVIERDEENPKIVKKARITGLAITHMPKNPKTFAEIIKGHTNNDFEEEEDEDDKEEKSLSTTSGAALVPESVDGSEKKDLKKGEVYQVVDLPEEKMYDLIFDTFPNITIEKAEKVYNMFNEIQDKMAKGEINNENLTKAMDILGLGSVSKSPFFEKAKGEDLSDDEVAEEAGKKLFKETTEDEEEDGKDEVKKSKTEEVKKAKTEDIQGSDELGDLNKGAVLILKKAIEKSESNSILHSKAVGQLLKGVLDQNELIKAQIGNLEKANGDLRSSLEKANAKIQTLGNLTPTRRSLTKATQVREKESFQKAQDNSGSPVLSISRNFKQVLDLVDGMAFAKGGYDEEFAKATISLETSKVIPAYTIQRIKAERGINIVD